MSTHNPPVENLRIYEGDDTTLSFISRLDSLAGYTISFQVRNEITSRYAIINLAGSVTGGNTYNIVIPSDKSITYGKKTPYYYGIKLTSPTGEIHTDRHGQISIEPRTTDITQPVVSYIYGVDVDKDGNLLTTHASNINFKGTGVSVVNNTKGGVDVTINQPPVSPVLALHFSGIYDTLQDLQDAIPKPSDNMQAIVISPSERYYHSVANQWVELAPVGSIHPKYLGVYDTVDDLKLAEPNAVNGSIAIIGTISKGFYILDKGVWGEVIHTDLPSIKAALMDVETKVGNLQQLVSGLQTVTGKNSNDIAGLYVPDKATFDSKVAAAIKPILDSLLVIQTTIAQQGAKLTQQVQTLSNVSNTLNGLETSYNNLRNNLAKAVVSFYVDDNAKAITFRQLDGSNVTCDISGMFSTPTVQADIYYGFSLNKVLSDLTVISGTKHSTHTLNGLDIHLTRVDAGSKYMYVWVPNSLPNVKGFMFDGFLDSWSSTPLTVNTVQGKVYVSDNPTFSQDVKFEVVI